MTYEKWKDIKGYDGVFQISNLGRVKSLERTIVHKNGAIHKIKEKFLTPNITKTTGYLSITLTNNNKCKRFDIHRLLAIHFIENPLNKKEVNHIDGNKLNCDLKNLEWVTRSENAQHAHDTGLLKNWRPKGVKNPRAKLTEKDVDFIRNNYEKGRKEKGLEWLAEKFNVSISSISRVTRNKTFKKELSK